MTTNNIPGDVIFESLALKRATERTATTRSSISATRSWASKSTRKRLIELIALDVQRTADTARWSSNSRASGSSSKWWWIRGNLKEKKIFFNKDLTRLNQDLYMLARNECRDKGLVYTRDGVIFLKRRADGNILRIRRRGDLEHL